MGRDIRRIVADVDALPAADDGDLNRLQALIDDYFASSDATAHVDVWFRFFERFPNDHGHGMFWSILHGLEAQPGYERAVVDSVCRAPTHFPTLMVNRMLNGGVKSVDGTDLIELLRQVQTGDQWPASVRQDAANYLKHQRSRDG